MKRLLSIFMLFVMLVVGIGPTLSLHFCGNSLHSVEVLSKVDMTSCCPHTVDDSDMKECQNIANHCCQTKEVEIITDSYQIQERVTSLASVFFYFDSNWITPNNASTYVDVDMTTLAQEYFPPEGYDVKNSDILTHICILRI